jgi:hypothetical protein
MDLATKGLRVIGKVPKRSGVPLRMNPVGFPEMTRVFGSPNVGISLAGHLSGLEMRRHGTKGLPEMTLADPYD